MRRLPTSFDATVSAFRELTAAPVEGAATRARVLERAGREARRRGVLKRIAPALAVGLVIVSSGAAAALRWRAPPSTRIDVPEARSAPAEHVGKPTRVVPALAVAETAPAPPARDGGERVAYERAHRAHFFADTPQRALAAWDEYIAAYPRGTFVPEARYNRALCLVRVGRTAAAAQALRPFATGTFSGYRRHEACLLLRWLAERGGPAVAEPSCAAAN
jgi:TolA-binding protein